MRWFHHRVVCFFGVPLAVRVDQGTEFKGEFQKYCQRLGVHIMVVYTAHPQANGLVERYNGVLRSGLRKMAAAHPSVPWTDLLPSVLAGLRFLPTRLGFTPACVVFKQAVRGVAERQGAIPEGLETAAGEASVQLQEQLIAEQSRWWATAELDLKERITRGDAAMQQRYAAPEAGTKVAFELCPGD